MRRICISLYDEKASVLFPLLQEGLPIRVIVGCSLESLLTGVLEVSTCYIDERIKTILLDGRPVDDLGSAVIENGSVLALSAAMPGLAGATLRRGGHLAPFREGITHQPGREDPLLYPGTITIKFFNVLIEELGIPMLARGLPLEGVALAEILKNISKELPEICAGVVIDDEPMGVMELLSDKVLWDMEGSDSWLLRVAPGCGHPEPEVPESN